MKFPTKNLSRGITLIELIIVIFIIAYFSIILISDFPKMLRQFALSRVTYKLAQDLRKSEDLGLSGVPINDQNNNPIAIKGYGIYINLAESTTKYIIYADVDGNQKYSGDFSTHLCSDQINPKSDCPIEKIIDISNENPSLSIKEPITNISEDLTSINFSPPNPTVRIDNINPSSSSVGITIGNTDGLERTIQVNTSGLISVQ